MWGLSHASTADQGQEGPGLCYVWIAEADPERADPSFISYLSSTGLLHCGLNGSYSLWPVPWLVCLFVCLFETSLTM